jgi:hypothetical protein
VGLAKIRLLVPVPLLRLLKLPPPPPSPPLSPPLPTLTPLIHLALPPPSLPLLAEGLMVLEGLVPVELVETR